MAQHSHSTAKLEVRQSGEWVTIFAMGSKNSDDSESWFVYIIECENGRLYTGVTNDLERRFEQHCEGRGAKFFRTTRPVNIGYFECSPDRGAALSREAEIKRLARRQKLALIERFAQGNS